MKKAVFLHIPNPCDENWNDMNAVEQGRFCMSCSKKVVDFSNKSDGEILSILSKTNENTCGRFSGNQLQRPMLTGSVNIVNPYKLLLQALIPGFLFFSKATSQQIKSEVQVNVATQCFDEIFVGKVNTTTLADNNTKARIKIAAGNKPNIIAGKVIDENGYSIPYASVLIGGSNSGTICDSAGNFKLNKANYQASYLSVSAAGFKPAQSSINSFSKSGKFICTLQRVDMLPEVRVVSYGDKYRTVRMGGLVMVSTVTVRDTIRTMISRIAGTQLFNVFPNPAAAGSQVQLIFKQPGSFSMQLFNNSGSIFILKEINILPSLQSETILIPASVVPGIYYIRATQKENQKSYTSKLVIK